jgi:hypothetical protein
MNRRLRYSERTCNQLAHRSIRFAALRCRRDPNMQLGSLPANQLISTGLRSHMYRESRHAKLVDLLDVGIDLALAQDLKAWQLKLPGLSQLDRTVGQIGRSDLAEGHAGHEA